MRAIAVRALPTLLEPIAPQMPASVRADRLRPTVPECCASTSSDVDGVDAPNDNIHTPFAGALGTQLCTKPRADANMGSESTPLDRATMRTGALGGDGTAVGR